MRNLPAERVSESLASGRDPRARAPVIALPLEAASHEAVERSLVALQRARVRERRWRVALFAWGLVSLVWLVPGSPWSPTNLPLELTLVIAVLLATVTCVFAWFHLRASDPRSLLLGSWLVGTAQSPPA